MTSQPEPGQPATHPPIDWKCLRRWLQAVRPSRSIATQAWAEQELRRNIPDLQGPDSYGNYWVLVGQGDLPVIWVSHYDTVHSDKLDEPAGPYWPDQKIVKLSDRHVGLAREYRKTRPSYGDEDFDWQSWWEGQYDDDGWGQQHVLGADNGAGVWLCLELYKAGVPGLYVFHADEEVGMVGSRGFQYHAPDEILAADWEWAISFDRRGSKSIITHQMGTRCLPDEDAWELSCLLGMGHEPDPTGSFTDSLAYFESGWCRRATNLAVGFQRAHSPSETLDLYYIKALRNRLVSVDWTMLPGV